MKSSSFPFFSIALAASLSGNAFAQFPPVSLSSFETVFQDNTSYWKEIDLDMKSICSFSTLHGLRTEQGLSQARKSTMLRLKTYRMGNVVSMLTSATYYDMHFLPEGDEEYVYLGGIEPVMFYKPKILCSVSGFSTKEVGKFEKDVRENGILIDRESDSQQPSVIFESFASYSNTSRGPGFRFNSVFDSYESSVRISVSYQDMNDPERWIVLHDATDDFIASQEVKPLPAGNPKDYDGGWAYDYPRREDVTLDRQSISYSGALPYPTLVRVTLTAESDDQAPHLLLLNAQLQTEECVFDASSDDGKCL